VKGRSNAPSRLERHITYKALSLPVARTSPALSSSCGSMMIAALCGAAGVACAVLCEGKVRIIGRGHRQTWIGSIGSTPSVCRLPACKNGHTSPRGGVHRSAAATESQEETVVLQSSAACVGSCCELAKYVLLLSNGSTQAKPAAYSQYSDNTPVSSTRTEDTQNQAQQARKQLSYCAG